MGNRGGDDGRATEAELNGPGVVAVTSDGGFLIADTSNHVVREVSAAGVISGSPGSGPRVPAATTTVQSPPPNSTFPERWQ